MEQTAGVGIISGRVYDQADAKSLVGATVSLNPGGNSTTVGINGTYRFSQVPAGSYTVTVSQAGYAPRSFAAVQVVQDEATPLDFALQAASVGAASADDIIVLEEFVVTAEGDSKSQTYFNVIRQTAPVSVDILSAGEISKFTGTDVSDLVIRIPGVSVQQGQFAVIRGLSERYSTTVFNGVNLPSADPERQSVPLDLFPAGMLESITVQKTFSPSLPSNSSGGAILLEPTLFPEKSYAKITVGARTTDDQLSGDKFRSYRTDGNNDLFAFGANDRVKAPAVNVPPIFNLNTPAQPGTTRLESYPLGAKFGVSAGGRIDSETVSERAWGYNFAFSYESSYTTETQTNNRGTPEFGDLAQGELTGVVGVPSFKEDRGYADVALAGVGTLAYNLNARNLFRLVLFASQTGNDRAAYRYDQVNNDDPTTELFNEVLEYRQRSLRVGNFAGEHLIETASSGKLAWNVGRIQAEQDEPDTRFTNYVRTAGSAPAFESAGSQRFFRNTIEDQDVAGLSYGRDFSLGERFSDNRATLGLAHSAADRNYTELSGTGQVAAFTDPFSPDDIAYGRVRFSSSGKVLADRELNAVHLTLESKLAAKWDLLYGARLEQADINSAGVSRYTGGNANSIDFYAINPFLGVDLPVSPLADFNFANNPANIAAAAAEIDRQDILPVVSLTYRPTEKTNIRGTFSQTVARPSFREFGNYFTYDPNDRIQHGNAALDFSEINNFDLRLERFGERGDLLAVSLFFKSITRPIEKITVDNPITGQPRIDTWVNNPNDADMRGLELEFRKNLGFVVEALDSFSIGGNYTRIDAEVDRSDFEIAQKAFGYGGNQFVPVSRRLYDQPEWLANADLTYDSDPLGLRVTLAYFATSEVLQTVQLGNYDLYSDSFGRLDLTVAKKLGKSSSLKLSVGNLTDSERLIVNDPEAAPDLLPYRSWRAGRTYTLSYSLDL